jgi:RNA polymerase-binding transcription factor DksA
MFKRCNGEEVESAREATARREKEGVYGICQTCDNPVYGYMTENRQIFDLTGLCGVCATGESAAYFDELNQF